MSGRGMGRLALIVIVWLAAVSAWSAPARATGLPDGRAFELVSEPALNGNPAFQLVDGGTVVLSDDAVIYGGGASGDGATQGDGPGQGPGPPILLASRSASGWSTSALSPQTQNPQQYWSFLDATPSLSGSVFEGAQPELFPVPASDLIPETLEYRDASGNFSTIATNPPNVSATGFAYGGMSADGQTVVFSDGETPTGTPLTNGNEVYAWHDSSYSVIAGGPGDALAGCNPSPPSATGDNGPNIVSADGSTVFLLSGSGGTGSCPASPQVYASVDGHSQEISVSTDGTPDPQSTALPSTFVGASSDGQTAYFVSAQPLTASATNAGSNSSEEQLYEWTAASAGSQANVTCVSCGVAGAAGLSGGNLGVIVSSQGDYVYFQTYDPSLAQPTNNQQLFVYHDGTVQLVDADPAGFTDGPESAQLSPDGSTIVFSPDTPTQQTNGPLGSLYRAVVSDSGVSTPQCITCDVDGTAGEAVLGEPTDGYDPGAYRGASTVQGSGDDAISADGNTVVFQTPNALGAADESSQVYEWTPSGGDQFIASGDPISTTGDAVITPDAQNLFFYSADSLTADNAQPGDYELYDARVGGGFPAAATAASCSGDACQGASPTASAPPVATTSACCGNASAAARSLMIRRPSQAMLRRVAHDGRLRVDVRVRGSGRLRITLVGTLARRRVVLGAATRKVKAKRTRSVSVSVSLSQAARRALTRAGRLSVTLVAHLPGAPTRSVRVTLVAESRNQTGGRS